MLKNAQKLQLGATVTSEQDKDNIAQRQQSLEDAMHLSVKDHIDKLDNHLLDLKEELTQSKKDLNFIREELARLRQMSMQSDQGVTSYVCDEINRLQTDLRRSGRQDLNQMDSFTNQIVQLRLDKEELDEHTRLTDLRTQSCENDVGFRRVYD